MGASVSYKLKNSIQGALAGGGDPATSPLYVFGPFLALIVGAGVAKVTFGASIWLAVFTVIAVAAMYRYVMIWVTDGSGGSGLSEEEFGGWAVKTNAAITVIEYTLTFLVSMAALVTFIADRFPILNSSIGFLNLRTVVVIAMSILVVVMVNRGPKMASAFFGPATALILGFLWLMVFAVIWRYGLNFPGFDWRAFDSEHLKFTLGGFARILALMTGIEIFANLVASYEGGARSRSRKAFGSMAIVMGTTLVTMMIVGPAIFELSDPFLPDKSVFTQTMDAILPAWLSYVGTLIGVAVLLSAAAASTQGIQNLSLGLRARHYIPARWGTRNRFDVPSFPSWAQVLICIPVFVFFGTHEETYLALYAAGVFILLSMTAFAACKRFLRYFKTTKNTENFTGIAITLLSALCASFATVIIFEERFKDGAWAYLILVPALYFGFDFFRRKLGPPPEAIDLRLSSVLSASPLLSSAPEGAVRYRIDRILVPLNGKLSSEVAFHGALKVASEFGAKVIPAIIADDDLASKKADEYLKNLRHFTRDEFVSVEPRILRGDVSDKLVGICESGEFDLICMSSAKMRNTPSIVTHNVSYNIIYATTPPILFFRPDDEWVSRSTSFSNILVPLDGSSVAEQVLPYVSAFAAQRNAKVTLICVPEIQGDEKLIQKLESYLSSVKLRFFNQGIQVVNVIDGSGPARTILQYASSGQFDLVAMVSHGRGGLARQEFVKLGSVTEKILAESNLPLLFISGREE